MSKPDVSIIVPVYNSEDYLDKLYRSLVGQTHSDIEIIFVNDGSTDNSLTILVGYKNEEPRISLINTENRGPSHARNLGLQSAVGEYVCFFDSDDYVEEHMIEVLLQAARSSEADLVVCGYYIDKYRNYKHMGSISKVPRQFRQDCELGDIIGGLYMDGMVNTLCNKLFRRSIIDQYSLRMKEDMCLSEDVNFVVEYLKYVASIVVVDEPLYHIVRKNVESLTTKYHENMLDIQEYTIANMKDLFAIVGLTTLAQEALYTRRIRATVSVISSMFHREDQRTFTEKLTMINSSMSSPEFVDAVEARIGVNWREFLILHAFRSGNSILIYFLFWLRSVSVKMMRR